MIASGVGRSLKYFIRQAEIYVLCMGAGSFALAAYMWLLSGSRVSLTEMLKSVPSAATMIAMILLFTNGVTAPQFWYSMPISFGCLRKNAYWGSIVMDFLLMIQTFIFYFITSHVFHMDLVQFEILFYIAMFLLVEGLSKFMGMASMKWGKAAYVVMIIGILVISMSVGFVVGYAGVSGNLISLTDVLGESFVRNSQWVILGISTAFCMIGNVASWHILKGYEVKT